MPFRGAFPIVQVPSPKLAANFTMAAFDSGSQSWQLQAVMNVVQLLKQFIPRMQAGAGVVGVLVSMHQIWCLWY